MKSLVFLTEGVPTMKPFFLLLLTAASLHAQAKPLAQDFTIVHHNPDPERYVEGPGLARLDDGTLLAVVPVVPREEFSKERRATQSRTHILRSADGGRTWQQSSELPYYSAAPWLHKGTLCLFANKGGTKSRNDDLLLLKSTDGGKTWSDPVTLFQGHFWNCHTGMVQHEDRLYWATDDLSLGKNRGPCVIVGDLTGDFMQPAAWRMSKAVAFPGIPDALTHPKHANLTSQYLEPNVIEVHGKLRVMATVKPKRQSTAGLAAVLDFEDKGKGSPIELKFTQYHPMPGGQLKFCIIRDEKSKMFWATANIVVDGQGGFDWWKKGEQLGNVRYASGLGGNDRRFLMLFYGLDGMNWVQAGCVAQAAKISQSFMYARPVIDGDDLAIIARSSINAPNQHDADHATFHRVKNFRQLALNLFPEPEGDAKNKP